MSFGLRLAVILGSALLGAAVPLTIDSIDRSEPGLAIGFLPVVALCAVPGASLLAMAERGRPQTVLVGVIAGVGSAAAFVPIVGSESSTRGLAALWLLYVGVAVGFAAQLVSIVVAERSARPK